MTARPSVATVNANKTTQVFLFDGSVGGNVQAKSITGSGSGHVQVCGMTIGKNVQIQKAGTDILVGDSLAGCGGNTIGGNLQITNNFTDVELDVRDNTIAKNLTVSQNKGPSDKFVEGKHRREEPPVQEQRRALRRVTEQRLREGLRSVRVKQPSG